MSGPVHDAGGLLIWGIENIDDKTREQARLAAKLPFVNKPLALMPDAHFGIGATVGSVIASEGAIIPAAVGVDIGCGMIAVRTNLFAGDLPDDLYSLMSRIEQRVPSGVGQGFDAEMNPTGYNWLQENPLPFQGKSGKWSKLSTKAISQFGTLGSGNHFIEVCLAAGSQDVWIVLHSGSRGPGNDLARHHIDVAKDLMEQWYIDLRDPDLAYIPRGTQEFKNYWNDLDWAQRYAYGNRERMMDEVFRSLKEIVPVAQELERINCHHNYTAWENHHGKNLMVTRKGAIKAGEGDLGIIPGSMGARSYIVEGLGNPASYCSCSHGAGRAMSRGQARKTLKVDDFKARMVGKTWLENQAQVLLDEHPSAYKDIDAVMEAQKDLVQVKVELSQILNYKGT